MPRPRPDIADTYRPGSPYVLLPSPGAVQHIGLIASLGGMLVALGVASAGVALSDEMHWVFYAMLFFATTFIVWGLCANIFLRLLWPSAVRAVERNHALAQDELRGLEHIENLDPSQLASFAAATLVVCQSLARSPSGRDAIRVDLARLDERLLSRGLTRPKAVVTDARLIPDAPADAPPDAPVSIRLPADRPALLLPWLAISACAWAVWAFDGSERAMGIAIGAIVTGMFLQLIITRGRNPWSAVSWRLAPGRIGRRELSTRDEVASDTHFLRAQRTIDGSAHLTFINEQGIALSVYAGHCRGARYRAIWRAWMRDGAPAPPFFEND